MAVKIKPRDLYIDRQLMKLYSFELEANRDIYESWSNSGSIAIPGKMHTYAKLYFKDDTEIKFEPKAHEMKEDGYHLYGLLETLFPIIAGDYYMEDWKAAYLDYTAGKKQLASQAIHRYTIDKNDNRFNTKEAKAFKAGYELKNRK